MERGQFDSFIFLWSDWLPVVCVFKSANGHYLSQCFIPEFQIKMAWEGIWTRVSCSFINRFSHFSEIPTHIYSYFTTYFVCISIVSCCYRSSFSSYSRSGPEYRARNYDDEYVDSEHFCQIVHLVNVRHFYLHPVQDSLFFLHLVWTSFKLFVFLSKLPGLSLSLQWFLLELKTKVVWEGISVSEISTYIYSFIKTSEYGVNNTCEPVVLSLCRTPHSSYSRSVPEYRGRDLADE